MIALRKHDAETGILLVDQPGQRTGEVAGPDWLLATIARSRKKCS